MGELLDKLILFLCCVLLLPLQAFSPGAWQLYWRLYAFPL